METKSKAVIRYNKEQCGIELVIPDGRRLSADEKQVLSSLGFAWHRKNKYYYTRYTEEKMGLIKASFLGKDSQFPAKTEEKVLKEMAKKRAAEKPSKKPARQSASAETNAKLDQLIQLLMAQQVSAITK